MIRPNTRPFYRAILVEDELRTRHMLQEMIEHKITAAQVELIASCGTVEEARATFRSLHVRPDLVFLDINLPDGSVFDLLDAISPVDFEIIFITAYDEYTRKACEYSSIAYLNKPVSAEKLNAAVQRAAHYKGRHMQQRLSTMREVASKPEELPPKLVLSTQQEIVFVAPSELVRLKADGNYTVAVYKKRDTYQKIVLSQNLGGLAQMLPGEYGFCKVHRSHIVNVDYVDRYLREENHLIMADGGDVPVSRRRAKELIEFLRRRG